MSAGAALDARTGAVEAVARVLAAASALSGEAFDRECAKAKAELRARLAIMGFKGERLEAEFSAFVQEALATASRILLTAAPARGSA